MYIIALERKFKTAISLYIHAVSFGCSEKISTGTDILMDEPSNFKICRHFVFHFRNAKLRNLFVKTEHPA
jgi:hypothetical protein